MNRKISFKCLPFRTAFCFTYLKHGSLEVSQHKSAVKLELEGNYGHLLSPLKFLYFLFTPRLPYVNPKLVKISKIALTDELNLFKFG